MLLEAQAEQQKLRQAEAAGRRQLAEARAQLELQKKILDRLRTNRSLTSWSSNSGEMLGNPAACAAARTVSPSAASKAWPVFSIVTWKAIVRQLL